ncbi:MAG: ornithine carbamoyltransferase [Alkalispirochaeta sp.]
MTSLAGRSLLTLTDYTAEEIRLLLDLSHTVKQERRDGTRKSRFAGYTLAMIFEKRSTRTRAAFETAFGEEGGHPVFLSSLDIQLGAKETIEDTARVLGRMFDIIEFRGFEQRAVEVLAEYSGVPVINGLTDMFHPTQALADLMTVEEHMKGLEGLKMVYIGDGHNNVSTSLMLSAVKMGMHHTVVCPPERAPNPKYVTRAQEYAEQSGGSVTVEHDPTAIDRNTHVVYTDVWVSMGDEEHEEELIAPLRPYQVTGDLMARVPQAIFLHCLPAVRGNEMTAEVIDGPQSRVFDQAENRKHTIKAIMLATLGLA